MMENIVIREASVEDKDSIWRIHTSSIEEVCSSHYSKAEIQLWSQRQHPEKYIPFITNDIFLLAIEATGGNAVGFGHLEKPDKSKFDAFGMQVKGLYVISHFIGKGIGKLLLNEMERRACGCGCSWLVVESTLNAMGFYKLHGFHEIDDHAVKYHVEDGQSLQCVRMMKAMENGVK